MPMTWNELFSPPIEQFHRRFDLEERSEVIVDAGDLEDRLTTFVNNSGFGYHTHSGYLSLHIRWLMPLVLIALF